MAKIEQDLKQLFENNFDGYTIFGEERAMTKQKFVEVVGNLLTELETNKANSENGKLPISDVNGSYDSQKCTECGGRTALIAGHFYYEPDDEPYNNGIIEDAKVEGDDCWVGGYKCDDCGYIQRLWHE